MLKLKMVANCQLQGRIDKNPKLFVMSPTYFEIIESFLILKIERSDELTF